MKNPINEVENPSTNNSSNIKPKHKRHFLRFVLVLISIIIIAYFLYPYLQKAYSQYRDKYAVRQPEWETFDENNKTPMFALVKITSNLVGNNIIKGQGENFFFLNRFSGWGGDSSEEECKGTQFKCGDEEWKDFSSNYQVLPNRCIIKIRRETYCNVLLPGGTLVRPINDRKDFNMIENFFYPDTGDFKFQVIATVDQITIKQSVTKQYSELWHLVADSNNRKYVVEVGDQTVETTGTAFSTSTDSDLGTVVFVKQGTVNIKKGSISLLNLSKGQVLKIPSFNTSQCPEILKPCGKNCIPANAVCCSEIESSYCLSPLQCGENFDGKCSTKLLFGTKSNYCCKSSGIADQFSLFTPGSYDCGPGYKFCGGMRCIPESEVCCYPDENHCGQALQIENKVVSIPDNMTWVSEYLYDLYLKLLTQPAYIKLIKDPNFPNQQAVDYFTKQFKAIITKDAAASNSQKENEKYCSAHPSKCVPHTSNSSSSSSSGSCANVPRSITVQKCYCNQVNSQGVWCEVTASGAPGQGRIPLACTKQLGLCR